MLSENEIRRFNQLLDDSPTFDNAFDRLLEDQGVRDYIYDPDRFLD